MADKVDLSRLREQTLGSGADEEAVTVNTRALIDKVLARYSGDWTTLRELIQNAADAQATKVTIKFETLPSRSVPVPNSTDASVKLKHILLHHTLEKLVVSNNGQHFAASDWNRLKRIAEGNPDETKIGAFGVGFYSVFADCENPFVVSGRESMAFYWKGNSLFTRTGKSRMDEPSSDTTFVLDYRSTSSPIPDLLSLCQFLSTSLTFVGLELVELVLDDWSILTLRKKSAPGSDAHLPKDIKTKTDDSMMKIVGVVHQSTQIDARWTNIVGWQRRKDCPVDAPQELVSSGTSGFKGLFSRLSNMGSQTAQAEAAARKAAKEKEDAAQRAIAEDLSGSSRATVFLKISTVNVQTYVSSKFAADIERATKKPPPKHTRIAILTSSYDETAASLSTVSGAASNKAEDIFSSVLPTKHGRIFIGFPTAQTTGLLCHISAPSVIPTVERESLDLNAPHIRDWNKNMLRIAGIACRIAYSEDMLDLKSRLAREMTQSGSKTVTPKNVQSVLPTAAHIMKQYTPHESTPSYQVGTIIEEAFWNCGLTPSLDVLSTTGVMASSEVRWTDQKLTFVDKIPVIPPELLSGADAFLKKLWERGLIRDMTEVDIRRELERRSLDEAQLLELLKWASGVMGTGQLDIPTTRSILQSAVATVPDGPSDKVNGQGKIIALSDIKCFVSLSRIPADVIVPPSTMPFRFTKDIPRLHLENFGWQELHVVAWLEYLVQVSETSSQPQSLKITEDSAFASRCLGIMSKQWDSINQDSKEKTLLLLHHRAVVPTKLGMRKPAEAYFPSVKLFDDLPTTVGLATVKEKFLVALGIRKTIELTVVFDRLMAQPKKGGEAAQPKWSFVDLVRYLVSVRDDIPAKDIQRLTSTAICPKEIEPGKASTELYKVSDLYEPEDELRRLGLPLLQWPGIYRSTSNEGKLLSQLGLKACPSVPGLVNMMRQAGLARDVKQYNIVLNYFLNTHHKNGYAQFDVSSINRTSFLKVVGKNFPAMEAPYNCFANERASIMGYHILPLELRPHAAKFGVLQDPHIHECARRLMSEPPTTKQEAIAKFAYMAGRLAEMNSDLVNILAAAPIVPILSKLGGDTKTHFTSPTMCFLGDPAMYGDILDFVDFGQEANSFLLRVGSKHEPSSVELARMVVETPAKILGVLRSENYQELLRKLASSSTALKADKSLWKSMKQAPFLLASRETGGNPAATSETLEEFEDFAYDDESTTKEYTLARAGSIVVPDSIREYVHFRSFLLIPPPDDALEAFYISLGVPMLSSLLEHDRREGSLLRDQGSAEQLRKHLIERSRVFLYEYANEMVSHDAKWLDKSLSVKTYQSLALHVSLRGSSAKYSEKRTALEQKDRNGILLLVTAKPDFYEISHLVVKLLLKRPKQNDVIALEMILGSDLRKLRNKGYNVDRILRQKAHQSKLAEEEQKKLLLQEEQRRTAEREATSNPPTSSQSQALTTKKPSRPSMPPMPGSFDFGFDSPPDQKGSRAIENTNTAAPTQPNDFLSRIFGLGGGQTPSAAPSTASRPGTKTIAQSPSPGPTPGPSHTPTPGSTQTQESISRNLTAAIHACRSHNSKSLFSPPSTSSIREADQGTYCDQRAAHDLSYATDSAAGIKIYISNTYTGDRSALLKTHLPHMSTFSFLLLDVGSIFDLSPQSLHIFYDNSGSTIAFNSSGALFFNYAYFERLHLAGWETSRDVRREAVSYWFTTAAHELAHNLASNHDATHSFYTESFVSEYFWKVVGKGEQY
ncbi:hypothetical protein K402DRAFT_450949 [Aulographum hederae CBS 113979]|uniref:Sacsin/Nov domain-containing protein n=1 Tax=Aulographum hederae CBS 113979 TaxID=1176131 RepID=A0A6G1HC13_9PEZI|nr:hypothetical protein K402DRAFT_450949 [Aulographum hederae CBS 113979]